MPQGSGCPLYSRLTKTTAKKPCFSKSGDAVSIRAKDKNKASLLLFMIAVKFRFKNKRSSYQELKFPK